MKGADTVLATCFVLLALVVLRFGGHLPGRGIMVAGVIMACAACGVYLLARRFPGISRDPAGVGPGALSGGRRLSVPLWILTLGMFFHLLASRDHSPWFYFLNWTHEDAPLRSGVVRFSLYTLLLTPVFALPRVCRNVKWLFAAIVPLLVALCWRSAVETLSGELLYRTDHPSFMFRLWEFGHTFPALGGYNPWWNAGTEHFAGVTSGIQGIGLLVYPLLRLAPVHTFYNAMVLIFFILLPPLIAALSVRAVGGKADAMGAAGLLAMGVSQHFFLWMWHFGTLGAAFSSVMVMPAMALAHRAAVRRRLDPLTFVGLAFSVFLMAMWAPTVKIVAAGLVVAHLWHHRRWTWKSFGFLAACAALTLLLYLPWLRVIFFPARGVMEYVAQSPDETRSLSEHLGGGARRLWDHMYEGHPALLFLGLGGVLAAAPRTLRRWYFPALLLFAIVCGWSLKWKPMSQFDRVSIPMMFAAVVPAAFCAAKIFATRGWATAPLRAGLFVLLVLGGYNVSRIYSNRGPAPAQTIEPVVPKLVEWIRENVPEDGRLLFAGSAQKAYGGGYTAYLPALTEREMMADDYYGFPRGTIALNYPPREYRREMDRFLDFAHAYNVTHVLTRHDSFRAYFARHPEALEPLREFEHGGTTFSAYRLLRTRPLLPEHGEVQAHFNRLKLRFEDPPPASVVLPYNWRGGLHSRTPEARIEPHAYDENINLIRVIPNGNTRVVVGYRAPWKPVEPTFDGYMHH